MAGGTVGAKGKAILVYFPIVCLSDHKLASLDLATLFFIGYLFFTVQANQIRRPSVVNQKERNWATWLWLVLFVLYPQELCLTAASGTRHKNIHLSSTPPLTKMIFLCFTYSSEKLDGRISKSALLESSR